MYYSLVVYVRETWGTRFFFSRCGITRFSFVLKPGIHGVDHDPGQTPLGHQDLGRDRADALSF